MSTAEGGGPAERPATAKGGALGVIVATTSVQMVMTAGTLILPAVAPHAAASLAIDPRLVGLQVSLVYGSALFAALVAAQLVHLLGATRVSQIALLLIAGGCGLAALPFLPGMAAGSVLMGLGYGLPNPAAAHLLARFTDRRRRNLIFSVKQSGVPLGGVLVGLSAPGLALAFGWEAPLLANAAIALSLAALLEPLRADWDRDRAAGGRLDLRILSRFLLPLRTRAVLALSIAMLLLAAIQLCLSTFAVTALVRDLRFDAVDAGFVFSATLAGGMAGRILWGWTADLIDNGLLVLLGVTAAIVVCSLLASQLGPTSATPLVVGTFVLLGATAIGWNGVIIAEAVRSGDPAAVAPNIAALTAFSHFGVLFGPALFFALTRETGSVLAAFPALAGIAILAAGALVLGRLAQAQARGS